MATPPVPPRPYDSYDPTHSQSQQRHGTLPPPVPPLPADFLRNRIDDDFGGQLNPHLTEPLVAPRPTRLLNDVPTNMAQRLDDQAGFAPPPLQQQQYGGYLNQYQPPQPPQYPPSGPGGFRPPDPYNRTAPSPYPAATPGLPPNPTPGFVQPRYQQQQTLPQPQAAWSSLPPQQQTFSPPPINQQQPAYNQPAGANGHHRASTIGITQSMQNLTFSTPPPQQNTPQRPDYIHTQSMPTVGPYQRPNSPTRPRNNGVPALTAVFPSIKSLTEARGVTDPAGQVAWAKDVIWLVEKSQSQGGASAPTGQIRLSDPQLQSLADQAVSMILRVAPSPPLQSPPPYIVEAVFLRGKLSSTGWFPDLVPHNPREAFRYFEASARAGYSMGWFHLGRDYEGVGDSKRALDCFERGVKTGSEHCLYRMGMVSLMGQLGMPVDHGKAMQLLRAAADNSSMDMPQPAYVYGLLLFGEFPSATVSPQLISSLLPPATSSMTEARRHIDRAAFLGFAPAQYKLGHCYEYATPPFPFDPLLSVQYYSLASQHGEVEADMALSKWFLCGAEGAFDKDENLAYTFAEKAAKKGLATAQFAMGYYAEVGVGRAKDLEVARKWYLKASEQGNADATERIQALSQPSPQMLSRQEHEAITDVKLNRRRTQARKDAVAAGRESDQQSGDVDQIINTVRKHSVLHKQHHGAGGSSPPKSTQTLPTASPPATRPTTAGEGSSRPAGRGFSRTPRPDGAGVGRGRGTTPRPTSAYNLSDNQFSSKPASSPPPPVPTPASTTTSGSSPPPGQGGKSQRPAATFQEMGIAVGKVDDKECVIM